MNKRSEDEDEKTEKDRSESVNGEETGKVCGVGGKQVEKRDENEDEQIMNVGCW